MNLIFALISAVTIIQGKVAVNFQDNNKAYFDELTLKAIGSNEKLKLTLSFDLFERKITESEISWLIGNNWMLTGGKYKPYMGSYFSPHESFWDWFGLSYTEKQLLPDTILYRMGVTILNTSDFLKFSLGAFSFKDTLDPTFENMLFIPSASLITEKKEFYITGGFKGDHKGILAGVSNYTRYHMEWFELAYNFQNKKLWGKQAIKFQVPYLPLITEWRIEEGIRKKRETMPIRITTVWGLTLFSNTLYTVYKATIKGKLDTITKNKVEHSLFLVFTF